MTALLDALRDVAMSVSEIGEVNTYEVTPAAVNVPAWFPAGVESMERHDQGGQRIATSPWWLVVAPGEADAQRRLYELADLVWDQLEDADGPDCVARVVSMTNVGTVAVAGTDYWGCLLTLELFV